jgi:ribosomal protein S18 acetylase RimI-like enzyme
MPAPREPLHLIPALPADVDAVFALYTACTQALLARGIRQWDDRYPDRSTAAEGAARGDLYWLVSDGESLGAVILNALPVLEYAGVVWRYPEPALVIHTLVIAPARQGAGLGRAAIAGCEAFARDRGFAAIRLDAFPGNPAAIALYDRLGYEHRAQVRFAGKPPGHEHYAVYEKRL